MNRHRIASVLVTAIWCILIAQIPALDFQGTSLEDVFSKQHTSINESILVNTPAPQKGKIQDSFTYLILPPDDYKFYFISLRNQFPSIISLIPDAVTFMKHHSNYFSAN
ncbi:hypothetical protein LF817_18380 [Halobacillus sp. A1]|uniref:hypothetical protein n=1 Tax=Halobacillus sp. A1 TaxID=2880262 RepID=UPI0020A6B2B2|nr:hypothetical protein [Halobacillus sp. A1]MCP3033297.1 hypothetical protein [Halobacillus sp. A1]